MLSQRLPQILHRILLWSRVVVLTYSCAVAFTAVFTVTSLAQDNSNPITEMKKPLPHTDLIESTHPQNVIAVDKSSAAANPVGIGYRVESIEAGSMYDHIGLKPGDIIKKFNGQTPKDAKQSAEMYAALKDSKDARVLIERDGHERILHYVSRMK